MHGHTYSSQVPSGQVKDRVLLLTSERILLYSPTDVVFDSSDVDFPYADLCGTSLNLDQLATTVSLQTFDLDNFAIAFYKNDLVQI